MVKRLFARKPLKLLLAEMEGENRLRRALGPVELTSLGVGCIIGTGIFVLVGQAAHTVAGPALILSFILAGLCCVFSALCYAEFASLTPVAGSAFTYAYATLGELFAWIIGWDLILEYTVASAAVAHGWSKYFQDILGLFHLRFPSIVNDAPFTFHADKALSLGQQFEPTGSYLDLPALLIVAFVTVVLVLGIRQSARFNSAMVILKVAVVLFVIAVGAFYVHPSNWQPFAPFGYAGLSFFGRTIWGGADAGGSPIGVMAGAALIFFAYIGFDSVSTHAEEARNPRRDVPIAIIASLVICTGLYIAVTAVLTGMVHYDKISIEAPVSQAFAHVGLPWAQYLIDAGAIAGITSVLLVLMLSQPRVLLAMARDGFLPEGTFGAVHPRFKTPWKSTILTGLVVATMAALLPLKVLADLVNIGTLLAFVVVCLAVLVMRRTHPDAQRPFRCPFVPLTPILGIAFCLLLMFSLPWENWLRLLIWLAVGFVIYFSYGRRNSVLARLRAETEEKAYVPVDAPKGVGDRTI